MITKAIKSHLSKDVPKNKKDLFSSKSLRISSIAPMDSHRGVHFFEIHSQSVHSLSTDQER